MSNKDGKKLNILRIKKQLPGMSNHRAADRVKHFIEGQFNFDDYHENKNTKPQDLFPDIIRVIDKYESNEIMGSNQNLDIIDKFSVVKKKEISVVEKEAKCVYYTHGHMLQTYVDVMNNDFYRKLLNKQEITFIENSINLCMRHDFITVHYLNGIVSYSVNTHLVKSMEKI